MLFLLDVFDGGDSEFASVLEKSIGEELVHGDTRLLRNAGKETVGHRVERNGVTHFIHVKGSFLDGTLAAKKREECLLVLFQYGRQTFLVCVVIFAERGILQTGVATGKEREYGSV